MAGSRKGKLMNISKKFVNIVSAAAIMVGMTAGIASAQLTDNEDAVLNVTCPSTASVDLTVSGAFELNTTVYQPTYNVSGVDFGIIMDLSCNWSDDFQVSASVGSFIYQGSAPSGTASWFSGAHLLWDGGTSVYAGPTIFGFAGAPDVEGTVFEFFETSDPNVINNDEIFFGLIDLAAPGITTASWDGHLNLLPPNLANGQYKAPLTVVLSVS